MLFVSVVDVAFLEIVATKRRESENTLMGRVNIMVLWDDKGYTCTVDDNKTALRKEGPSHARYSKKNNGDEMQLHKNVYKNI